MLLVTLSHTHSIIPNLNSGLVPVDPSLVGHKKGSKQKIFFYVSSIINYNEFTTLFQVVLGYFLLLTNAKKKMQKNLYSLELLIITICTPNCQVLEVLDGPTLGQILMIKSTMNF